MFREVLEEVVRETDGGIAALLMGIDGIAVERYVADDSPLDVESIGMEYSVILSQIRKAAELLDAGTANEVAVTADRMTTVIRLLNEQYFVAIALKPEGNLGKARFLLRTRTHKLLADLT